MKAGDLYHAYRRYMRRNGTGRNGGGIKMLCCVLGGVAGFVIAAPFFISTAATLTAVAIIGGGMAAGKIVGNHAAAVMNARGDRDTVTLNEETENCVRLLGHKRDVQMLAATQKVINALTDEYKQVALLPENVERLVNAYVSDAADAALRVRAYDKDNQPIEEFHFTRQFEDLEKGLTLKSIRSVAMGTEDYKALIDGLDDIDNFLSEKDIVSEKFDATAKQKTRVAPAKDIVEDLEEDLITPPSSRTFRNDL